MRRGFAIFAMLAALCAAQAHRPSQRRAEPETIARTVFDFVNAERRLRGVRELQWDIRLAAEARRHASNMATRWFFAHDDPVRGDVGKRLTTAGVAWRKCSENLFQENGYDDPAREADLRWLASPGHRRNMLDPEVTHAGTGAARRSDGSVFVVEVYIRPLRRAGE